MNCQFIILIRCDYPRISSSNLILIYRWLVTALYFHIPSEYCFLKTMLRKNRITKNCLSYFSLKRKWESRYSRSSSNVPQQLIYFQNLCGFSLFSQTQYENNQKLELCAALIRYRDWSNAQTILDRFTGYWATGYKPLNHAICELLHHLIEPLYTRLVWSSKYVVFLSGVMIVSLDSEIRLLIEFSIRRISFILLSYPGKRDIFLSLLIGHYHYSRVTRELWSKIRDSRNIF